MESISKIISNTQYFLIKLGLYDLNKHILIAINDVLFFD